jgi:hypothetical protein
LEPPAELTSGESRYVATTAHSVRVGSFFERVFGARAVIFISSALLAQGASMRLAYTVSKKRVASAENCDSYTGVKVEADQTQSAYPGG